MGKQFSRTIHINSVFDTSSILSGLEKIQQQLQASTSSKGRGMLSSIELEIDKAKKTLAQMQDQVQKGFGSTKEVSDFDRQLERTSLDIMEIYRGLKDVAGLTLSDGAKALERELDKIAKQIEKVNKEFTQGAKSAINESKLPEETKKQLKLLVEQKETTKELYDAQKKALDEIIAREKAAYILAQDRAKLQAKTESAEKTLGKKTSLFSNSRFNADDFGLTRKGYNTTLGESLRQKNEAGNIMQKTKVDDSTFETRLNTNYIQTLIQIAIQGKNAADAVAELTSQWEKAGLVFNREKLAEIATKDFNKIVVSDQLTEKQLKELQAKSAEIEGYKADADVIDKTRERIVAYHEETKAISENEEALRKKAAEQANVANEAEHALNEEKAQIDSSINSWEIFRSELLKTAETQTQIDSGFNSIANRLKYFFSARTVFRAFSRAIRDTYNDVKELDKSFAEIAMVTSYSVNDMWQSYGQYAQMANRLGQATNDVIKASALFYQQGLDTNEALVLTEDTMKLATLASIDFAEATDLMTAALRGFKLEMDQGAHITDVYSELAAHAAANVQEIAVAMNKTAAIANSAGMSFENTAAFLTQMIEGTQESAANIGTAMKTVVARFTELKENVDASDSEFDDLDYNKVDKALKSVGIQLKDVNGQFRNLDDVFLELSGRWQSLSRNEQRYIATTAAGSRQQSRFIALMDNYARTIELVEIAQNSQGRSSEQFAKYSDSVEYSVKRLQNTWEQFRVSLADNEFYKKLINTANELLEKISKFDGIDWAKTALIFLTVGKLAGQNFLKGMQTAISSSRTALQKSMSKALATKDNLIGRTIGQKVESRSTKVFEAGKTQAQNEVRVANQDSWIAMQQYSNYAQKNPTDIQGIKEKYEVAQQKKTVYEEKKAELANYVDPEKAKETQKKITEDYSRIYTSAMQTVGTSAAAAFTTAFTVGMMTDDPGEIFKATLVSGATAAVPGIINTFSASLAQQGIGQSIVNGLSAGIVAGAVTAAIAAAAWIWKTAKKNIEDYNENKLRQSSDYYDAIKTIEELKEAEKDLGNAAYEASQKSEKSTEAYQDLKKSTDELEELRKKIVLTSEDQERLIEVSNEIAKLAPELVQRYDEEGNAVIGLKESYEDLLEVKKNLMLEEKQTATDKTLASQANTLEQNLQQLRVQNGIKSVMQDSEIISGILNANASTNVAGLFSGSGLNKSQERQEGSMLKTLFSNIPGLAVLNTVEDQDVLKTLKDKMNDLAKYNPEKYEETVKYMQDAINNYVINVARINKDILDSANEMLETEKDNVRIKLEADSKQYGKTTDTNVRNLMTQYSLASNDLDWDTYFKKNPTASAKDWQDLIQSSVINVTATENKFTDELIHELEKAYHANTGFRELAETIYNIDKEIYETVFSSQNDYLIDAYNNRFKKAADLMGIQNISKNDAGFLESSNKAFEGIIKAAANTDNDLLLKTMEKWFSAGFKDRFNLTVLGYTEQELAQIFSIDWSAIAAHEYAEQLDALSKEADIAKPKIQHLVETLGLTNFAATSSEEFKNSINDQIKAFEKYDKVISAIKTAGDSFAKDGKVSVAGIEAIYDQGLDVAKLIHEDLSFDYEEAKRVLEETFQQQLLNLEVRKQETLELQAQLAIINGINRAESTLKQLQDDNLTANSIATYFTKNENGKYVKNADLIELHTEQTNDVLENWDSYVAAFLRQLEARYKEYLSAFKGFEKEEEEAAEKRKKAEEAVQKAYKDVLEKQEAVLEKEKALNKVLYGDSNTKNKLDVIYNYTTALDKLKANVEDAKRALDDLQGRDPGQFLDTYISGIRGQKTYLTASNDRYNAAINNIDRVLSERLSGYLSGLGRGISNNVSDYYSYNSGLDRYVVNYGALNAAQMNNDLRAFIEEQVDLMNQYKKNIKENVNAIEDLEKEFRDYQKKARDNYISVQDEVAKTLKEFYEQQVENKKELYERLEEADTKYLDALEKAIEKQRKLREKQNQWDELSLKEKKLSLLQRDTSGANQKVTQSLQKDIRKDREKLLDDSVDNVVNELKEFYDLQKETRDLEIEYQENVIENTNYIKEANALLEGWKTVDEMREWMWEHTKDINNMSDQAVEKLTEDWETMFDNIKLYNELTQKDIVTIFDVSTQEVQDVVLTTSETLTTEADRAFNEITEKVNEAITNAEKAVQDAMEALATAQETYNEKLKEFNELIEDTGKEVQKLMGLFGNGESEYPPNAFGEGSSIADLVAERKAEIEDNGSDKYSTIKNKIANDGSATISRLTISDTDEEALWNYFKEAGYIVAYNATTSKIFANQSDFDEFMVSKGRMEYYKRYANGGLANYTGLAWIDGTPTRPEAFLNADDTIRIGEAANILANLASLGTNGSLTSGISSVVGDTNSQINIYVNSIATESQVDYLIDRVKEEFVDAANPIGTSVILHK